MHYLCLTWTFYIVIQWNFSFSQEKHFTVSFKDDSNKYISQKLLSKVQDFDSLNFCGFG